MFSFEGASICTLQIVFISVILRILKFLWNYNINDGSDAINRVGIDCNEGPPVPIPNTEVKLIRVDNTWRVTAREDR